MNTQRIPNSDLAVSRISLGCMKFGGTWSAADAVTQAQRDAARVALRTAIECGINFFDHADIYCRGKSESVMGDLLAEQPGLREKILIQSKCGIRFEGDPAGAPGRFDFSHDHIIASVEGSLRRLRTDRLDVLLLHRPDPLVEPEEVARAFDALHAAGKVRHFGVSNHTPLQIELLRKFVRQPIVANQVELSPLQCQLIDDGVKFNNADQPASLTRGAQLLDYCRLHDIAIQAWGPVANGKVTQMETVTQIARARGVPPEAVAMAWLLRHPARIQPVFGSLNPQRIRAACTGDGLALSREEWYRIYTEGRGGRMP